MHGKHTVVRSLEEDFKEIGLDPKRALGTIENQSKRVEERVRTPADPHAGKGDPPTFGFGDTSTSSGAYREVAGGGGSLNENEDRGSSVEVSDEELRSEEVDGVAAAMVDMNDVDPANQEEAVRAVKKKIKTAAQKLKSRLQRRKHKAQRRKASRMYRKRNKRKIAKRLKKRIQKFGRAGLEKLHKMGRRVVMADKTLDPQLANLREELNEAVSGADSSDYLGPFEEAATNSGWLALLIGEVFEASGDNDSAEKMYALSDRAADLAEELEGITENDGLSEDQEEALRNVVNAVVKGVRFYEGIGAPSLGEAIEYGEEQEVVQG